MKAPSHRILLWSLALTGAAIDLASKYFVFRNLYAEGRTGAYDLFPGAFEFIAQFGPVPVSDSSWLAPLQRLNGPYMPHVNEGALFGLGGSYQAYANSFFAIISVVAATAIGWYSTRPGALKDRPLCVALGLILGGTIGNLFDRVVFHGVRDFMHFYWFEYPVFNFADCCLVCGASYLLLQAFWVPAGGEGKAGAELAEEKICSQVS